MVTVNTEDMMQYLLIGLLLLFGYYYIYRLFVKRTASKSTLPIAALILFLIYAAISAVLIVVFNRYGSPRTTLLLLLVLMSMIGFCVLVYYFLNYVHEIRAIPALLLLLYLGVVSYITVFSRQKGSQNDILLDFSYVSRAIRERSLFWLQHPLLNVGLFLPVGFLFTATYPKKLNQAGLVIPFGLMLSVMIETAQMILQNGQCDLEDLITNALGAYLGLLIYRLIYTQERQ